MDIFCGKRGKFGADRGNIRVIAITLSDNSLSYISVYNFKAEAC
jgi:hypothetical protein